MKTYWQYIARAKSSIACNKDGLSFLNLSLRPHGHRAQIRRQPKSSLSPPARTPSLHPDLPTPSLVAPVCPTNHPPWISRHRRPPSLPCTAVTPAAPPPQIHHSGVDPTARQHVGPFILPFTAPLSCAVRYLQTCQAGAVLLYCIPTHRASLALPPARELAQQILPYIRIHYCFLLRDRFTSCRWSGGGAFNFAPTGRHCPFPCRY